MLLASTKHLVLWRFLGQGIFAERPAVRPEAFVLTHPELRVPTSEWEISTKILFSSHLPVLCHMSSGAGGGAGWYHKIICAVWSRIPVCQLPEIHETEKAEFTTGTRGGAAEPEEDKIQPSLLYLRICLYGCSVCGSHMSSHLNKIFNQGFCLQQIDIPEIPLSHVWVVKDSLP